MTAIRIRSPLIERFDIAWITEELIGISAFEEIPGFVFVAHWLFSFLVVVVWDLRQEGLSRGLTSSPLLRVHRERTTPTYLFFLVYEYRLARPVTTVQEKAALPFPARLIRVACPGKDWTQFSAEGDEAVRLFT